ncbi:MAG TPA: hypothetical protein VK809_01745 [Bacteroidia bacterium]|jgi:hypothetical protein|nr:hypothetical protein [Bacteroidia bacterium]
MKKLLLGLSVSILGFSFFNPCSAQTFQSGSLIVSLTYGFDIYSTQYNQVNNYLSPPQTISSTGGAASGNVNLGAEFGVTNWLGLGLQGKFDSYLHKSNFQSANGGEYGILINFHIIRHLHFDLLGGFDVGGSQLTLTSNDGTNDQVYGSGSWFDIHFTSRVYIGKFGFSATLYFPSINYSNLTSNVSGYNEFVIASLKAHGEGLNFGVQYHFLK